MQVLRSMPVLLLIAVNVGGRSLSLVPNFLIALQRKPVLCLHLIIILLQCIK